MIKTKLHGHRIRRITGVNTVFLLTVYLFKISAFSLVTRPGVLFTKGTVVLPRTARYENLAARHYRPKVGCVVNLSQSNRIATRSVSLVIPIFWIE